MVQIVSGPKGSGKTKTMIDYANDNNANHEGEVVFINDREKYRVKLDNQIRYINVEDFFIDDPKVFFGFLNGVIAENYDITTIYIDNVLRIVNLDNISQLESLFSDIRKLEDKYSVQFVLSVCAEDSEIPEFMKPALS
ncbi:hypothetical protein J0B03_09295 [Alkalibacter rhizosphaerae]|uniref:Twitching motility protein PilT n=1 Tax=Alkalibacter rhizosphaerae TaxID=2815577 RepID=A0A974XDU0_9FIRM|nr:hypothetical protein [Alkalibacter rhizosphaerae]QSX07993.1 hypothetical protein J0B03_09295 [Alkalibacter rhizosphaerae]